MLATQEHPRHDYKNYMILFCMCSDAAGGFLINSDNNNHNILCFGVKFRKLEESKRTKNKRKPHNHASYSRFYALCNYSQNSNFPNSIQPKTQP